MRRVAALVVLITTAWAVREIAPDVVSARGTALALGLALIAAALSGDLGERIGLPRITGYLVFGMLCGPYLGNIISRPMARDLQVVNGIAISLIALIAGLELNVSRLRPRLREIAWISGVTLALMYLGLFGVSWLAWPWLPIAPTAVGIQRVAFAAVLATLLASFSPTVTIAVIADARARGPLCELVLSLVVMADLALIVAFTLILQFARWSAGADAASEVSLLARLSWEIFGSMAFGCLAGALFAIYLRRVGRELTVVLLALCAVLAGVGEAVHLEPLLAALAAGLVVENIAPPPGDALKLAIERGALPILVVFFAAAGTSLHIDALGTVGIVALALALVRVAFIRLSTAVALRGSRALAGAQHLWMGLVSQAGVTLGLTIIVRDTFQEWGANLQTLVVALIAIHELVGPILFKAALTRVGEVGRLDDPALEPEVAAIAAG